MQALPSNVSTNPSDWTKKRLLEVLKAEKKRTPACASTSNLDREELEARYRMVKGEKNPGLTTFKYSVKNIDNVYLSKLKLDPNDYIIDIKRDEELIREALEFYSSGSSNARTVEQETKQAIDKVLRDLKDRKNFFVKLFPKIVKAYQTYLQILKNLNNYSSAKINKVEDALEVMRDAENDFRGFIQDKPRNTVESVIQGFIKRVTPVFKKYLKEAKRAAKKSEKEAKKK
jgi:hypothetical protein